MSQELEPKQANTQEPSKKERAPSAPPTRLDAQSEASVTTMIEEVKAPGTNLGRFARKVERLIREYQDVLNEHGGIIVREGILGHKTQYPVKLAIQVGLRLQVGDGPSKEYVIELAPNPQPAIASRTTDTLTASVTTDTITLT